ncbi:MAG: hypothetical protein J2P35_06175 [Actinobacteria bacterium]|nr:hypothetical protein [Actinomycetota bacterium]MBO0817754.1 hypothetical protein [Actinomycetota bacterium]
MPAARIASFDPGGRHARTSRRSGGSTITSHEVVHVTLLPGGKAAVSFGKRSLSCG